MCFQSCNFDIADKAFSNSPFQLTELILTENQNMNYLRKEIFIGLNLQRLEFKFNQMFSGLTVDSQVLEHVPYLTILQLQYCITEPAIISNITGENGSSLSKVVILDFSDNQLLHLTDKLFDNIPNVQFITFARCGIATIHANAFQGVYALKTLILESNSIKVLDVNTFKGLSQLEILKLNNNQLTTLPDGVFNSIYKTITNLTLDTNKWECECSLRWLQQLYINQIFISNDPALVCNDDKRSNFTTYPFCDDINTSSSTSMETTPPETETSSPSVSITPTTEMASTTEHITAKFKQITCRGNRISSRTGKSDHFKTIKLNGLQQKVTLDFYEYLEPFLLQIIVTGN